MAQAVSRKRAKPRAATHGRQRRFGVIWVISCLSIAALAFFSWPARPAKRAAPVVATAAMAPVAEEPQYELRMKPIEDYRLGERFIAINPFGAEDEPEPDPATWKSVRMQLRKPSGDYLKAGFLLSPRKMDEFGVGRLPTVKLDLPEMGISGDAEVLSIDPCPEIEPGEGSVVTGIFEQMSEGNLFNVFFDGRAEPLGVTDNHPFYSLDRGEYVTTGELRRGELLSSAYDGVTARVAGVERRPADELVYNLQVNGHHVYHVGPLAVLVHNTCPGLPNPRRSLLGRANDPRLQDAIGNLYRPNARVASGSSMDAVRFERATGQLLSRTGHTEKLIARRSQLMKLLRDSSISQSDRAIIKELLIDIQDALSTALP